MRVPKAVEVPPARCWGCLYRGAIYRKVQSDEDCCGFFGVPATKEGCEQARGGLVDFTMSVTQIRQRAAREIMLIQKRSSLTYFNTALS